jgi:glycosyltransferase involved in cell wall biosynthesis
MRVALLNNLFGDKARGGAERVVAATATALLEKGHEVRVFRTAPVGGSSLWHQVPVTSISPVGHCLAYEQLAGRTVGRRLAWQLRHLFDGRWPKPALAALRDFGPDVVHTHNLMGFGFRLPRQLDRAGYRHVHTLHDIQLLHPSGWQPAGRELRLSGVAEMYAAVCRRVFGSPDGVTAPSRFLLDEHVRRGFFAESETVVLRNPVPEQSCADRLAPEKPVFLFAGQLETHKGVELLLKAWQGWAGAAAAELRIAGDGRLRPAVVAAADRLENVRYLGHLSADNLKDQLRHATYLVVPSIVMENLPLVATEALAAGLPVVAAQNGGLPEIVREGETGFLFVPGDDCALRDSLNRALAAWQGRRWTQLSAAARTVGSGMSVDHYLDRLLALYRGGE